MRWTLNIKEIPYVQFKPSSSTNKLISPVKNSSNSRWSLPKKEKKLNAILLGISRTSLNKFQSGQKLAQYPTHNSPTVHKLGTKKIGKLMKNKDYLIYCH